MPRRVQVVWYKRDLRVADHRTAYHHAQETIRAVRERPEIQRQAEQVLETHGSRG